MNYLLRNENAIYYECAYSCDNVIFVSLGSESYFITDPRYTQEAKECSVGVNIIEAESLINSLIVLLRKHKIKSIIFDPNDWNVILFNQLKSKLQVYFLEKPHFSMKKRAIKSDEEIKLLKKAVQLGKDGFNRFSDYLNKNGLEKTEKYLFFQAQALMTNYGDLDVSFDPIVAIGLNASKPHALPTNDKLKQNDLLLLDAGIKYKRYCSDRTRTININNNIKFNTKQHFNKTIQKAYDTVLKAHDYGIKYARVGMKASEIDQLVRGVIEDNGFGKYFIHSTGHGVGLDIHEYPFISSKSDMIIEENMVYTIEPGIYIPKEFGIRIEDMIVMDNTRAVVL